MSKRRPFEELFQEAEPWTPGPVPGWEPQPEPKRARFSHEQALIIGAAIWTLLSIASGALNTAMHGGLTIAAPWNVYVESAYGPLSMLILWGLLKLKQADPDLPGRGRR